MASFMEIATSNEPPKSKLLYHCLYSQFSYFEQYFHAGLLIRRFSMSINDGTLYLLAIGPLITRATLQGKGAN